ncbi:hypothetical protein AWC17_24990 [Mycobacterium nebraskense]|uniref:Uncharacterized protein n=1 Tax=Mycobacterium nebraskense TaxID=244292 RepID=A0A1X1ZZR1_9MYCO|nr:hypothetical protein AWC17_24990 [Mycobacterium nebraskense]
MLRGGSLAYGDTGVCAGIAVAFVVATFSHGLPGELVGWRAADAGRSVATGADGSASGRKRRERSAARR